jgi:hypothetical protein
VLRPLEFGLLGAAGKRVADMAQGAQSSRNMVEHRWTKMKLSISTINRTFKLVEKTSCRCQHGSSLFFDEGFYSQPGA